MVDSFFFSLSLVTSIFLLSISVERMAMAQPLFCDITWRSSGDPAGNKETSSMMIANTMLNYCNIDTMLHITCCGTKRPQMLAYLNRAKEVGIRNLLALRGGKFEIWKPQNSQVKI